MSDQQHTRIMKLGHLFIQSLQGHCWDIIPGKFWKGNPHNEGGRVVTLLNAVCLQTHTSGTLDHYGYIPMYAQSGIYRARFYAVHFVAESKTLAYPQLSKEQKKRLELHLLHCCRAFIFREIENEKHKILIEEHFYDDAIEVPGRIKQWIFDAKAQEAVHVKKID